MIDSKLLHRSTFSARQVSSGLQRLRPQALNSCSKTGRTAALSNRRSQLDFRIHSYYQETDNRRQAPDNAPSASSTQSDPPPPPPPPPPPQQQKGFQNGPTLLGVLLFLLLGSGIWWKYLDNLVPDVKKDEAGLQYIMTKGGNKLVVGEDKQGRIYFIDKNLNFYYDTGDIKLGFYMVTYDNKVYNLFTDGDGKQQRVFCGFFDDLKTQKIKSLGGIPVEKLEKAAGKAFNGQMTGFVMPADPGKAPTTKDFTDRGMPVPRVITELERRK